MPASAFAVEVEPGLTVRGNRELLSQALANLIDNALKYGAPGRDRCGACDRGQCPARRANRSNSRWPTTAQAFRPSDRDRVLDRFVRLEGARSRPGSGLGLSLAAAIAQLHGGTLRSSDNRPGLRIVASVCPLARARRPPPSPAPGP